MLNKMHRQTGFLEVSSMIKSLGLLSEPINWLFVFDGFFLVYVLQTFAIEYWHINLTSFYIINCGLLL